MITRNIEVSADPKEVAELLFDLDNKQVAEVFNHWKRLFDSEYESRKANNQPIWIFDLCHFMMHVIPELDSDGLDLIRSMYTSLIIKSVDEPFKYNSELML
jgi:hypothetical protein